MHPFVELAQDKGAATFSCSPHVELPKMTTIRTISVKDVLFPTEPEGDADSNGDDDDDDDVDGCDSCDNDDFLGGLD